MNTLDVTTLADSGEGSLRSAIDAANQAAPGTASLIVFKVEGVIALDRDLPALSRSVTINATQAPNYQNAPVVAIDCQRNAGLVFATGSDWSQLLGLAIYSAGGHGVALQASQITLAGNWIGLDLTGAQHGSDGDGIHVESGSSNNHIGFNPTASSGVVSNVVSGNGANGIALHGSSGNTLVNNYIGTDSTGTTAISNGENGILFTEGSHRNMIGGVAYTDTETGAQNNPTGDKGTIPPVIVVPPLGNVVSGNGRNGVRIDAGSQYNVLSGNFIGTVADGNASLGNREDGVLIDGADNNSLIGCTFQDNPFVYYNVVSGNGGNGLHVTNSNNTTVHANFFGIAANNAASVPNNSNGILADGTSKNVVIGGVIPLGNVCAGNDRNGIEVRDQVAEFITFNTFGGLLAFQRGAVGNGENGLLITATGGNQTVQTNEFSGNKKHGVEISGDACGVTMVPNIIGLNTTGSLVPNRENGVEINGNAHDNVIGGKQGSVIPQNTFSGNLGFGLGNGKGGILIGGEAANNTIGGSGAGNLIGANIGNGITLSAGTQSSQILDNSIGFDKSGKPLLVNTGEPIEENGSSGNTISGNQVAAVCEPPT